MASAYPLVQRLVTPHLYAETFIGKVADYEYRSVHPDGSVRWMYSRSRLMRLKRSPLNYWMLGELNTQPRTSYLAKLRNMNHELESNR